MILNSFRSYIAKFSRQYGDLVLCDDYHIYWRKKIFPHYKENRKKSRENSIFDWKIIFASLNKIKSEIKEIFPAKFLSVAECEADDIIAILVKNFSEKDNILIVSGDKDFVQLYKYNSIKQYSPVLKIFLEEEHPVEYLNNKIIHGDIGDGIPNILSSDDTFVSGKRQRPITAKFLSEYNQNPNQLNSFIKTRLHKNRILIDFDYIPEYLENDIMREFEKEQIGSFQKLYKYLKDNNMKALLSAYGELKLCI